MPAKDKVSEAVVRRLPVYHRYLERLEEEGVTRISSQELGARMGLTASQIRQDINCFGALGQQGYGYNVSELRRHIAEILGLGDDYGVVVIGAGNIGRAVASYTGFARLRFRVEALFDTDEARVGERIGDAEIHRLDALGAFLADHPIDIGIVATPAAAAQGAADMLVAGGVRAIWNFAPVDIAAPEGCAVQNVQLTDNLLVLTYHIHNDAPGGGA